MKICQRLGKEKDFFQLVTLQKKCGYAANLMELIK